MINFEQQLQNEMVCTYLKSVNGCDKNCQKCHRFIEDSEIMAAYHAAIDALKNKRQQEGEKNNDN